MYTAGTQAGKRQGKSDELLEYWLLKDKLKKLEGVSFSKEQARGIG